jgi:hypothetical protein
LTTGTKEEQYFGPITGRTMPAHPESQPHPEPDRLEIAADQAIAASGGDARDAVKALIVANQFWNRWSKSYGPTCRRDTRAATTTEGSKLTQGE